MAQVELVGSEYNPRAAEAEESGGRQAEDKGVGDRLKAAAQRMRGGKGVAAASKRRTDARDSSQSTTTEAGGSWPSGKVEGLKVEK